MRIYFHTNRRRKTWVTAYLIMQTESQKNGKLRDSREKIISFGLSCLPPPPHPPSPQLHLLTGKVQQNPTSTYILSCKISSEYWKHVLFWLKYHRYLYQNTKGVGHNTREVRHKRQLYFNKPIYYYLALINREGGLYWENLDRGKYRPNAVRSVHTTEVKILPYRPT